MCATDSYAGTTNYGTNHCANPCATNSHSQTCTDGNTRTSNGDAHACTS